MEPANPRVVRRALARAESGKSLSPDEVSALMDARGHELEALMSVAARLRSLGHGTTVTYSRKVFVPLTMLCRDHCHYCTFAKPPARMDAPFLSPDEVVAIADGGRRLGCKEALFTLGDRPEDRYAGAREWLAARGFTSTLDYVRAAAIAVIESTGLLPHLNPGVMSYEELARLKHVSASMGLMLETSSDRLSRRGGPHFGSPDKVPAVRLRTIEDAGRLAIPFTTGILVGIGETARERAESLLAIRDLHRRYGHVQEVIVQNFLPKPGTAMHRSPPPEHEEYLAAVATARVVFGPHATVQAPPNLSDPAGQLRLLDAGIDDWGGVSPLTPDHVNPERPWPAIDALTERTAARGLTLRERLTLHPRYALRPDPYLSAKMRGPVSALVADDGLAVPGAIPEPVPWQDPDVQWKPRSTALTFAKAAGAGLRADADAVYGDLDGLESTRDWVSASVEPERLDLEIRAALRRAERHRPIGDDEALALFRAEGAALEALCAVADGLRREAVGDAITYVRNRNINFTNVCYVGCRFCAFAQREVDPESYTLTLAEVAERTREAVTFGATEVCMQGGIHPDLPGEFYFDLLDAVRDAAPDIHIHAFSPMEVLNGSTKLGISFREFLQECRRHGLGTIPGTAAEILDDDVRWLLTKGKLPADTWETIVREAHDLGIRSSSTIMYGHVDAPPHWVFHIRRIARIQVDTGGFTEFVPLPFVHQNAPIYLAGKARPGATFEESRRMHAIARILLDGVIHNVQVSWVKLGVEASQVILQGGANDFGGTLHEETISRMAGASWGIRMEPYELEEAIRAIGRIPMERTTTYEMLPGKDRGTTFVPPRHELVAEELDLPMPLDAVGARFRQPS
ncbi:MAG TPA: bifunctional FO biosynthesis protein CofGH [Actinomycetota bacterium]|nr:bifunctional FO biosynthesis protein CofGH [Actinomycetota bacterium]